MAMAQKPICSLVLAMTPEELFTAALGLGQQWRVVECRFEGEPKRLELRLEHVRGQHFECAQCGTLCGVHDTIERRWRHLNFFQYRCELVAKVPRTARRRSLSDRGDCHGYEPRLCQGRDGTFPQAKIVFDKFHLMVLAGQALDEVRRELGRDAGSDLKGALWSLRGNAWNLSGIQQAAFFKYRPHEQ
jgi:transposase